MRDVNATDRRLDLADLDAAIWITVWIADAADTVAGIEVAQFNCIDRATRIAPVAAAGQPAVEYIKDIAREHYQILSWSIPTQLDELVSLECRLNPNHPNDRVLLAALRLKGNPAYEA